MRSHLGTTTILKMWLMMERRNGSDSPCLAGEHFHPNRKVLLTIFSRFAFDSCFSKARSMSHGRIIILCDYFARPPLVLSTSPSPAWPTSLKKSKRSASSAAIKSGMRVCSPACLIPINSHTREKKTKTITSCPNPNSSIPTKIHHHHRQSH